VVAVDEVSFDLADGEILGLLGPNGAGKTTTIHMLLGTLTYTSGSIKYFGKEFKKHRSEILQYVSFASTYVNLPWKLTLEQNLDVFGRLYGLNGAEIKRRQTPLLERFGIANKLKSTVASLSAGQLTRLILVKAFLVKPKIALLDEPTASLDPDMAKEVCRFLMEEREKEGTTMLFTSHKMDEVAELCDRVLFLDEGKIIANDLPENLIKTISTPKIELVIVDGMKRTMQLAKDLKLAYKMDHRWIELEMEEKFIAEFLGKLVRQEISFSSIKIHHPTLEDYFLKMVRR
ncbi:MAG: ABC transporter ATP-binding protein, partial [Rhabdochlamydiaceae bacterium]